MAIAIILALLLLLGAAIAFFVAFPKGKKRAERKVQLVPALVGLFCLVAFFIVPFSIHTVQAGQVAVVKHLGQIVDVKAPGTYFNFWMTNKYVKYDSTVQNVDISTAAYSSDAQTMTIAMTLQYQIISDKTADIATQYGSLSTLQNRIQSVATEKAKSVLSAYKAMDIIADRASMSPSVEAAIKEAVGESYYVNIHTVVLTNIDFSDAFELAVEEKMIAEQAKLKADYENQTKVAQAEAEAEAKLKAAQAEIDIAKANADAKLEQAKKQKEIEEANAEALKISAQAEADANKIISESVTPELLDKILAEKWDGKLPTVVGSDGQYILPGTIFE
ncbi:MAG: prohibitin family protein [Clostridia bacterium]|nr:prohibitin family protein [Clostridia bacterium]